MLPPDPFHSLLPSTFLLSYLVALLHETMIPRFLGDGIADSVE